VIEPHHLPPALTASTRKPSRPLVPGSTLHEVERHAILTTLEAAGGSTTKAARVLGVSVRMIQYRLRSYSDLPSSSAPALDDKGGEASSESEPPLEEALESRPQRTESGMLPAAHEERGGGNGRSGAA
jgi:transposase